MDISKIRDKDARSLISAFFVNRNINREFYILVPEDKFDFRMMDTANRKSASPRESLVHQIDTTRDYINGVKTGFLKFDREYQDLHDSQDLYKDELLNKLKDGELELVNILSDLSIVDKKVHVPWSKEPIPAIASLWGLNSHEILHTGWNLAIMDHLNIERFPLLKKMWG